MVATEDTQEHDQDNAKLYTAINARPFEFYDLVALVRLYKEEHVTELIQKVG
jgi:hypothetical protein